MFWQKAFKISIYIFGVSFTIAIIALLTNWLLPDSVFNDPAYSGQYVGIKEIISFIKAIDTADFYVSILSGISSIVSYIGKQLSGNYW